MGVRAGTCVVLLVIVVGLANAPGRSCVKITATIMVITVSGLNKVKVYLMLIKQF